MARDNLANELFRLVNRYLAENGMKLNRGTIVEASIISAPTSTQNSNKQRTPDIHQTRKGNRWDFGMNPQIGVDRKTKRVHSLVVTPANGHDAPVLSDLLPGDETSVWGDSA